MLIVKLVWWSQKTYSLRKITYDNGNVCGCQLTELKKLSKYVFLVQWSQLYKKCYHVLKSSWSLKWFWSIKAATEKLGKMARGLFWKKRFRNIHATCWGEGGGEIEGAMKVTKDTMGLKNLSLGQKRIQTFYYRTAEKILLVFCNMYFICSIQSWLDVRYQQTLQWVLLSG